MSQQCQQCGAEIPSSDLGGHCPRCLVSKTLLGGGPEDSSLATALRRFGDYELIGEIARGGMGIVYRARQISLNRMVALKMILAGEFATPEAVRRFRNEAEAAARLRHPNIVTIHEVGERDGQHYFVMELVEGPNFAALVREGPLPGRRTAVYVRAIAEAVAHAHAHRVLHRDIKPSNILLDPFDLPRVTDFGLARQLDSVSELTLSGQAFGSPGYMSPEQATGHGQVTAASDIYSLGAVLYHLLTGRPPFQGETIHAVLRQVETDEPVALRRLNPSVPIDLETISLKCLDKEPARRYGSATELAEEIGRYLRDEPIQARPLGKLARFGRWMRRHPTTAGLGASILVLLTVLAIGSTVAAWRVAAARQSEYNQRRKAETANQDLVSANERLADTVRLLELQRAEDRFRAGDPSAGVAHLAAILRRDPTNHIAANRLVSALVHRDWALPSASPILHRKPVEKVMFSPDGRHLLTVSRESFARISDAATGKPLVNLLHSDQVLTASYSSDGRRIVTASADGTARIWDATNGTALVGPMRHQGKVLNAEFSRDGRRVLTASGDRTARIWDASNGKLLHELRGHTGPVLGARLSPDGTRVVTAGDGGSMRLWDAETGQQLLRMANRRTRMTALEFSPDGRRIVWSGDGGGAQLWDAATGQAVGGLLVHQKPNETVWSAAFSPDATQLLTCSQDGTTRLWDAASGQFLGERAAHDAGVIAGSFSRDGEMSVTASMDNSARLWNLRQNRPVGQPLREMERILDAAFSPDGRRLATASYDSVVQVWDIRPRGFNGSVVDGAVHGAFVSFSPDGNTLLVISRDHAVHLFDAPAGGLQAKPALKLKAQGVQIAEFSPDGRRIVTGSTGGQIQWWETTGQALGDLAGHSGPVLSLCFSPDGKRLASASADGTARIWDAESRQALTPPMKHRAEISLIRFSPDGRYVATASEDWSARIWNSATGQPVTDGLAHLDHLKWVSFSPESDRVVTASTDNTACIWSIATGRPVAPRLRHARIVERAIFSPDGRRIVTASIDRTVRVWDAQSGQALTEPMIHDSSVSRLDLSPDGRRILSAGWNGTARLWDLETGQPLTEWLSTGTGLPWICLDSSGRRMAEVTRGLKVMGVIEAKVPVPEWFPAFAEAVGGLRMTPRGHIEQVPRLDIGYVVEKLSPGGLPADEFYRRLVRWFVADPAQRETEPALAVTPP